MKRLICLAIFLSALSQNIFAQQANNQPNLANIATATGQGGGYGRLNDGQMPVNNNQRPNGRPVKYLDKQWVQYEWQQPIATRQIGLYWHNFNGSIRLPKAYRIEYWDGNAFVPVKHLSGAEIQNDKLSTVSFDEITTSKLRLEADSTDRQITPLQEWIVYQTEGSAGYAPVVIAGVDRDVMLNGKTYLSGRVRSATPVQSMVWTKVSGPGNVTFSDVNAKEGSATFSAPGNYQLSFTATNATTKSASTLKVKVCLPPPAKRLDVVYTRRYKIDSKLWNDRAKAMIVNWIPFCIDQCERTDLKEGEGGIDNFIEAAKALHGQPHGKHKGYVFSNAWVHQTVEAICEALMVDPQGDKEIIAAQEKMQRTLDKWIPIILAAQEPDGYLQTAYTLRDTSRWHDRWSPRESRGNHEGYTAGYFIESAINHYTLTEGKDKRLYNAAKKLADCWVANLGPGKKEWYDGHQEMEQALVRFGRFVNDQEGHQSHGDSYVKLAKFLLDSRKGGSEYDQSHVPVQQQYEAVGHAVRATYNYSGMADVAAETGDVDYQSAVMSIWDNLVNKKYYLTGGIGSGETSEGFGGNYSLGNGAYCESCSSCGLIFFEYKMNLAYHDAKYADLYEETMYNALLGSLDLDGKNFLYTNPLAAAEPRYQWHVCPCCVGNIPRTLLMMPTWTYVRGDNGLYVNLFVGSTIKVDKIAGTDVEMIQRTNYPWSGKVTMIVNPQQSKEFTVYIRVPNRTTSNLYTTVPQVNGLKSISVNGKPLTPKIVNGYAIVRRLWKKGDRIDLELPMEVQRVTADEKIAADRGKVALRYGPLLYNVETADNKDITKAISNQPLTLKWNNDFLHGIMTINGTWSDGSPLLAIPNYSRLNRVPTTPTPESEKPKYVEGAPVSTVWMNKNE
ncbi:glycoside hydrolase family 127 protein [Mucilaginibacter boryungensis]|uniref:Glycoside hydrolase family 127 protein n=1 Tax=Mucilaginibacter boryungensis TaxID=768480 RepID=A0ABR9XF47_9SPHI|nr:beta-L-arabinofuranosidase domain-containing protein [Mucilaginibacter boryungensis]MBE9665805.1 glycoside hydrolase family 127 protein [Mucilaginibacter boryungensis]